MPCPVCASEENFPILSLPGVPVLCNQLWPDAEQARAAECGDVALLFCRNCAFIWNVSFDPQRMQYATGYENALHYSKTFQVFADALAKKLVDAHALQGKHVLEIGCGDGHFLSLMARHGVATATGFDPSMAGRDSDFVDGQKVRVIPELFSEEHFERPFDFVICRHVLEHLDDPLALLRAIWTATVEKSVPVYFEVPNAKWMLADVSLWDVIYEHVGYWSATSLSGAFRRADFRPLSVETGYSDQFLMIEARPVGRCNDHTVPGLSETECLAADFKVKAEQTIRDWERRLDGSGAIVVWGAGSKGITFANLLGGLGKEIAGLVDLNPHKQGRFIPGLGAQVVAPKSLSEIRPETVVIANALYRPEITQTLNSLGLTSKTLVLSG